MNVSTVFRSGVNAAEIKKIRSRTWHLDCPVIRLTRHAGAKDLVCAGAGEVRITPDGLLAFKLITNLPEERPREFNSRDLVAGGLLPEEKYLDLVAEDVYGRTWKSVRLLPDDLVSGPSGDVISGVLDELLENDTLPIKASGSQFSWWTDEALKLPANRDTVTKISIARGKRKAEKYAENVWSFRCLGIDFLIHPRSVRGALQGRREAGAGRSWLRGDRPRRGAGKRD